MQKNSRKNILMFNISNIILVLCFWIYGKYISFSGEKTESQILFYHYRLQ